MTPLIVRELEYTEKKRRSESIVKLVPSACEVPSRVMLEPEEMEYEESK